MQSFQVCCLNAKMEDSCALNAIRRPTVPLHYDDAKAVATLDLDPHIDHIDSSSDSDYDLSQSFALI